MTQLADTLIACIAADVTRRVFAMTDQELAEMRSANPNLQTRQQVIGWLTQEIVFEILNQREQLMQRLAPAGPTLPPPLPEQPRPLR